MVNGRGVGGIGKAPENDSCRSGRHFEERVEAMDGKAMVVCMSRRICVGLYDEIVALRPDWHSDDDTMGAVKVVMTGSASDPEGWQPHIGSKARRDLLAKAGQRPERPAEAGHCPRYVADRF